ncbi:MAG: hypothetical protein JST89_12880 [Cyanobacteria bacterium SZAS-4]|nr:hypothetical protein [Cyanobacteria bacterium SZAS-4]
MNTKFQSQILASALVLASTTVSLQPSFAASKSVTTAISASATSAVVSNDNALWDQVWKLLDNGQSDDAMAAVNQAIKTNSKNATAYVLKTIIMYTLKGDTSAMLEQVNIALSLDPNYADALYVRGNVYEAMSDLQSAVKDFDACVALNCHDVQALDQSTKIKFQLKDWSGMLATTNIAIANNKVGGYIYFYRAYAEYQLGQTSAAISDFKQAQTMFVAESDTTDAELVSKILTQLQAA